MVMVVHNIVSETAAFARSVMDAICTAGRERPLKVSRLPVSRTTEIPRERASLGRRLRVFVRIVQCRSYRAAGTRRRWRVASITTTLTHTRTCIMYIHVLQRVKMRLGNRTRGETREPRGKVGGRSVERD